ncbi:GAF domain-containing protein [Labrenzia sp. OB1]|uniref:GAF domain-containing protein n=1 Tax=Labrenzia sp. OB1 TaxID=1561204 RepID=UPI000838C5C8|nr:GAF domain-containing protein [Labrenzia sp. OB1]
MTAKSPAEDILALTGCAAFTILLYDHEQGVARRVYSSRPEAFSARGTKPLAGAPWANHVIRRKSPLISDGPAAIRAHFDDHAAILALGIQAIVNFPLLSGDACLGSLNCLYQRLPSHPDPALAKAVDGLGQAVVKTLETPPSDQGV